MDHSLRCRHRRRMNAARNGSRGKPLRGLTNDAAHDVAGMGKIVNHADGLSHRHVRYIVVTNARRRLNLCQFVSRRTLSFPSWPCHFSMNSFFRSRPVYPSGHALCLTISYTLVRIVSSPEAATTLALARGWISA